MTNRIIDKKKKIAASGYNVTKRTNSINPASILYKSIAGRYRPVSYPDGPITARYRFIKNAYWEYTDLERSAVEPTRDFESVVSLHYWAHAIKIQNDCSS